MVATVLALAAAVVLAVAYPLLSDRLELASVARRQLDVWAFLGGLVCLTGIVFGGADVLQSSMPRQAPGSAVSDGPAVVVRQMPVSLAGEADERPAGSEADAGVEVVTVGPMGSASESESVTGAADGTGAAPYVTLRRRASSDAGGSPSSDGAAEGAIPDSSGVLTPSLEVRLPVIVEPTVEPVVVVLPTADPLLPPTSELPGPVPTEVAPAPRETPTPVCGDPRDMVLELDVLDASLLDEAGGPSVRYRAQVHNRSTFPVTLADIHVALEGRDSGAEVFGSTDLPDLQVEPSVVHALEGTLALSKSPSPFGTAQLCVSLVSHTCGRTLPYHATKRCLIARGF